RSSISAILEDFCLFHTNPSPWTCVLQPASLTPAGRYRWGRASLEAMRNKTLYPGKIGSFAVLHSFGVSHRTNLSLSDRSRLSAATSSILSTLLLRPLSGGVR